MSQILRGMKNGQKVNLYQGDEGKPELSMAELLSGMVNQEFFFHHQPILDLVTEVQVGSEMLIRWVRRGEVLTPMWFMPMIEHHGLNNELDQYVLNRFSEIPWAATAKPDYKYRVFINISAQSFINPDFIECVMKITQDMQANSVIPVLELTERTSCELGLIRPQMVDLHQQGIELAIDDFGAGYSSLLRLIELPIDILKIDRSIINMIGQSLRVDSVIKTIFQMAEDLSMKVVAEGVETEAQANWLSRFNQCWAQGFYYARPTLAGFESNRGENPSPNGDVGKGEK